MQQISLNPPHRIKSAQPKRAFFIMLVLATTLAIFSVLSFQLAHTAEAATFIHVNAAVIGGGIEDGSSWPNAYSDLQTALSAATAGDEIWVA
ncbi:MAG: hypothetical protein ACI9EW_003461, partial [Cellvibrionaceae bacterium]